MNIKNLLPWIKGLPKKLGVERLIIYPLLIILTIIFLSKCDSKPVECPDCEAIKIEFAAEQVKEALAIQSSHTDLNPQPTKVITEEKIVYKNHTTFVKNWNDLQAAKDQINRELREKSEILKELEITKSTLDSIINSTGSFTFETLEPVTEPPLILTDKSEKTDDYEINEFIYSRGPLETYNRSIKVFPRIVEVTKTEVETLKRHNFLAFKGGAFYLDNVKNLYYTPSLEYGHKWYTIEAGPVLDKDFKFKGAELKAGFVIKWK